MPKSTISTIDLLPAKKQSSSKLSSLASRVLDGYYPTKSELRSLAASVLSQDETPKAKATPASGWLEAPPASKNFIVSPIGDKWKLTRECVKKPLRSSVGKKWAWLEARRRASAHGGSAILMDPNGEVITRTDYAK